MEYLLDTNICAFLLRGKYDIDRKLRQIGLGNCHISEITYAELLFGVERSSAKEKNKKLLDTLIENIDVIPISDCLEKYAKFKNALWTNGTAIDDFDLLIGTTSVQYGYTMVTENVRHFRNIPGIIIENWVNRDS